MGAMSFADFKKSRELLGLTEVKMALLLGVGLSTLKGWGVRNNVPDYIKNSVEAHLLLSDKNLQLLVKKRT